ncbi:WD40 repeat-like protein [Malassezia caprae]|uniref:WD40 repeat-like protein n=1 Tax=Malassezia caprae TaxID=1381934 RepID=A0AAF0E4T2_9BASI|nr:WD40 repeat-like protein [Malassezia caprae]
MSLTLAATYPPNPANVRAQSTKLGASPQGDRILYTQGRTVVLRDLHNVAKTVLYAQHTHPVTVARMSPSGFYVASGDTSGKVRIWDVAGTEQVLKLEVAALGGRIHDLVWDGESKRVLVVGEGREKYAHAFHIDTGSSVGELHGHSKPVNAVAVRAQRPFKAVTGSDDGTVLFYTGVPFKYARTLSTHSRFVQDVAYAPNGATFASAGADGRLFLYDGVSGDVQGEFASGAHQGTIFALCYSPDSACLASAGADGAVRVWDVARRTLLSEWRSDESDKVHAQQVGLIWARENLVSLSFSGVLTVLNPSETIQVVSTLVGPCLGLTSLVALPGRAPMLATASHDGHVYLYDASGVERVPREEHLPGLLAMSAGPDASLVVASLDDAVRTVQGAKVSEPTSTTGQPRSMHVGATHTYVLTEQGVDVVRSSAAHHSLASLGITGATAITATDDGRLVALGTEAGPVHLFAAPASGAWTHQGTLSSGRSAISAMAFSPDGALLAVGEGNGKILVYNVSTQTLQLSHWVFHTARVHSIAWSADSKYAVSASLDTHIYVWSVEQPMKHTAYKNAHANGAYGAVWLDERTIASGGADGAVRQFTWAPAQP